MYVPVTGLLSSFVNVSFLTSLLNTDVVKRQARRTAAMATCFSASYVSDMVVVVRVALPVGKRA